MSKKLCLTFIHEEYRFTYFGDTISECASKCICNMEEMFSAEALADVFRALAQIADGEESASRVCFSTPEDNFILTLEGHERLHTA